MAHSLFDIGKPGFKAELPEPKRARPPRTESEAGEPQPEYKEFVLLTSTAECLNCGAKYTTYQHIGVCLRKPYHSEWQIIVPQNITTLLHSHAHLPRRISYSHSHNMHRCEACFLSSGAPNAASPQSERVEFCGVDVPTKTVLRPEAQAGDGAAECGQRGSIAGSGSNSDAPDL